MWHDNPMVVVEDNDVGLALHMLDLRKSDFGIIKRERRRRTTRARIIKRYKRESAERKKQRLSASCGSFRFRSEVSPPITHSHKKGAADNVADGNGQKIFPDKVKPVKRIRRESLHRGNRGPVF